MDKRIRQRQPRRHLRKDDRLAGAQRLLQYAGRNTQRRERIIHLVTQIAVLWLQPHALAVEVFERHIGLRRRPVTGHRQHQIERFERDGRTRPFSVRCARNRASAPSSMPFTAPE